MSDLKKNIVNGDLTVVDSLLSMQDEARTGALALVDNMVTDGQGFISDMGSEAKSWVDGMVT